MENLKNSIAMRLQQVRDTLRMNQKEFAEQLGISLRAYQNYERAENIISVECIYALHHVFDINPTWLITGMGLMLLSKNEHGSSLSGTAINLPLYPGLAEKIGLALAKTYGISYNALDENTRIGVYSTLYTALSMLGANQIATPSNEEVEAALKLAIKYGKAPLPTDVNAALNNTIIEANLKKSSKKRPQDE